MATLTFSVLYMHSTNQNRAREKRRTGVECFWDVWARWKEREPPLPAFCFSRCLLENYKKSSEVGDVYIYARRTDGERVA